MFCVFCSTCISDVSDMWFVGFLFEYSVQLLIVPIEIHKFNAEIVNWAVNFDYVFTKRMICVWCLIARMYLSENMFWFNCIICTVWTFLGHLCRQYWWCCGTVSRISDLRFTGHEFESWLGPLRSGLVQAN